MGVYNISALLITIMGYFLGSCRCFIYPSQMIQRFEHSRKNRPNNILHDAKNEETDTQTENRISDKELEENINNEDWKKTGMKIPPATITSPYPVILDHTGRPWHSNKSLENISNLQRDTLPYKPTTRPDGSVKTWRAYLGPGQSMLRRRPAAGQVPHFEVDDERWHAYYERLVAYKENHGHTNYVYNRENGNDVDNTKIDYEDDIDSKLGAWCNRQRYYYSIYQANNNCEFDTLTKKRTAFISEYRIEKLREIGFDLSIYNYKWHERYEQLKAFYTKHGHCRLKVNNLDIEEMDTEEALYFWVKLQRLERKKFDCIEGIVCDVEDGVEQNEKVKLNQNIDISTTMTQERIDLLNEINFDWDPRDSAWERNFERLRIYHKENGNCRVPSKSIALQDQDDEFNLSDDENEDYELDDEQAEDGDTTDQLYKLGKWVNRQRELYRNLNGNDSNVRSSLTAVRISKLNTLYFEWDPLDSLWNQRYQEMLEYKKIHRHCNVPVDYEPNPSLGIWTSQQRKYYHQREQNEEETQSKKNNGNTRNMYMTKERIEKLEEIGFAFRHADMQWEDQFNMLLLYKEANGDCNVPRVYKANAKLGNWVHWQRRQYQLLSVPNKTSSMTKERKEKLEEIGFEWEISRTRGKLTAWEKNFVLLKKYKKIHGHCNVGKKDMENDNTWRELYPWVLAQRSQYKLFLRKVRDPNSRNVIKPKRIQKLESLGFIWNTKTALWNTRLAELKAYKEQNGNCRVPISYAENKKLGQWVSVQRVQYKKWQNGDKTTMTEKRIVILESLDFEWSIRK